MQAQTLGSFVLRTQTEYLQCTVQVAYLLRFFSVPLGPASAFFSGLGLLRLMGRSGTGSRHWTSCSSVVKLSYVGLCLPRERGQAA